MTRLILAAGNDHENLTSLILEKGADVNVEDSDRSAVLKMAAECGNGAIAQMILEKGKTVDQISKNEALLSAVKGGHKAVVRLLLANGTDIGVIRDESKDTWGAEDTQWRLNQSSKACQYGTLGLFEAVRNDEKDIARILLEEGADIEATDEMGNAALHWAVTPEKFDIGDLLINLGANVHVKNGKGQTTLHWAAIYGREAAVSFLLEKGVDPKAKDHLGSTALQEAFENRHTAIVRLLLFTRG